MKLNYTNLLIAAAGGGTIGVVGGQIIGLPTLAVLGLAAAFGFVTGLVAPIIERT